MNKAFIVIAALLVIAIGIVFAPKQSAEIKPLAKSLQSGGALAMLAPAQPESVTFVTKSVEEDSALKARMTAWEAQKHRVPAMPRLDKEAFNADPRLVIFRSKNRERWVELAYGTAFKTLNLTPGQVAGMRDLLAQRQVSLSEFDALVGKTSAGDDILSAARQASVDGIDQQITELIGAENYAELKSLRQRKLGPSPVKLEAGADMSLAGTPLNDQQAQALEAIYQQRRHTPGTRLSAETGLPSDLNEMFEKARQHLTASQLNVFLATLRSKAEYESLLQSHKVSLK